LARVLLTRAYYSTGGEAQQWFTKAKDAAADAINNAGTWGLSLYDKYSDVGQSVYGATAARAANKEAMFVLSYSETNSAFNTNATGNPGGNRIFKWTLAKYTGRPGLSTTYSNAYGVDNEQRLMPTWHLLDLFDETMDARYNANFQELWIANQAFKYDKVNWKNDKLKYIKDSAYVTDNNLQITLGDTAMFFTKKVWGGTLTRRYLEVDRNELYQNPQPGQGAKIVDNNTYLSSCYPSFKKFVNPNRTSTTPTDFGDALVIRLAEMYLIAAEAYVQLGDAGSAVPYVNKIRERAGLTGQKDAMKVTAGQINIDFILDERGREFAGELQRWYDLKRVFHDKQAWASYIKKWNPDLVNVEPYHWVRPVPLAELDALANPKEFGQNEGYTQP
jgi:starch-binding outer membrane protein, SusD/RagB family